MPGPADSDAERLKRLEERLRTIREKEAPAPHQESRYAQANLAWRMVIELVAGLSIGFGIGYGLDRLFGTTPFLLILFIFLGLAAGVKAMLRSAEEVQKKTAAPAAEDRNAAPEAGDEEGKSRGG